MSETGCTPVRIREGKGHRFDPESGWCVFGCGNRDDGRIVTRGGTVIAGGSSYPTNELEGLGGTGETWTR